MKSLSEGSSKLLRAGPSLLSAKAIIISAPTEITSEVSAQANFHFYPRNVKKQGEKKKKKQNKMQH